MKLLYAFLILLCACQPNNKPQSSYQSSPPDVQVLRFDVNEELAGSAYRKRATGYLMVTEGDSSLFFPAFTEAKDDGRISLILGLHPSISYADQMKQLHFLLPYVAKDYNFDSLSGVFVGRLIQTGDLAIEVTNEYLNHFGGYGSTATTAYDTIASFLSSSKLGRDFDKLLDPYGLQVSGTSVEKVFYTEMPGSIKIDSTLHNEIPDKILDAMVWVKLNEKK